MNIAVGMKTLWALQRKGTTNMRRIPLMPILRPGLSLAAASPEPLAPDLHILHRRWLPDRINSLSHPGRAHGTGLGTVFSLSLRDYLPGWHRLIHQ